MHTVRVAIQGKQAAACKPLQITPFPAALVRGHVVQPFGSQDHVAIVVGGTGQEEVADAKLVPEFCGVVGGGSLGVAGMAERRIAFLDPLGLPE
jgi:hypothetical protein